MCRIEQILHTFHLVYKNLPHPPINILYARYQFWSSVQSTTVSDLINAPLQQMRHLGLKCNFHALFKCAHPRVPILLCTNFARHLVAKDNFQVLMACYPALVIIFSWRINQIRYGSYSLQLVVGYIKFSYTLELLYWRETSRAYVIVRLQP